jgi:hypothetical protein
VATSCHELGHALGLAHHVSPFELMHFLGRPLGGALVGRLRPRRSIQPLFGLVKPLLSFC